MKAGELVRVLVTEDILGCRLEPSQPYEVTKRLSPEECGIIPLSPDRPRSRGTSYVPFVVRVKDLEKW